MMRWLRQLFCWHTWDPCGSTVTGVTWSGVFLPKRVFHRVCKKCGATKDEHGYVLPKSVETKYFDFDEKDGWPRFKGGERLPMDIPGGYNP